MLDMCALFISFEWGTWEKLKLKEFGPQIFVMHSPVNGIYCIYCFLYLIFSEVVAEQVRSASI